jgi:hypothetical protein
MYTDPERSHVGCNVSSLTGTQFLLSCSLDNTVKVRKVSYIYGCIFLEDKQKFFEPDWNFGHP